MRLCKMISGAGNYSCPGLGVVSSYSVELQFISFLRILLYLGMRLGYGRVS